MVISWRMKYKYSWSPVWKYVKWKKEGKLLTFEHIDQKVSWVCVYPQKSNWIEFQISFEFLTQSAILIALLLVLAFCWLKKYTNTWIHKYTNTNVSHKSSWWHVGLSLEFCWLKTAPTSLFLNQSLDRLIDKLLIILHEFFNLALWISNNVVSTNYRSKLS